VTYAGHPVCAAVAIETLKIYEERDLVARARALAPQFLRRLTALEGHPMVHSTRAVGLIGALELVQDKATRKTFDPASGIQNRVLSAGLEVGLICRLLRDTVAVCPPLIITEPQIDELFDKLAQSLDLAHADARKAGLMA
jgi:4-aminobutyrate--pyruvate transaminase